MECRYSEPSTPGEGTPWGSERHSEASEAPDISKIIAVIFIKVQIV